MSSMEMILKAVGRSIILVTAWLMAGKGLFLVVNSSDVLGKVELLTKLLATAWFLACVRFVLVVHSSGVPDEIFPSPKLLATA